MECSCVSVDMVYELADAAGEANLRGFFRALVGERDLQPFIQKRKFAQALRQGVKAKSRFFENRWIRMKRNFRSGLSCLAGLLQFGSGLALFVSLLPHAAIA